MTSWVIGLAVNPKRWQSSSVATSPTFTESQKGGDVCVWGGSVDGNSVWLARCWSQVRLKVQNLL